MASRVRHWRRRRPADDIRPFAAPRRRRLGTAILLAAVVGSGIMAESPWPKCRARAAVQHAADRCDPRRADPVFGPISGAHFNPAVTLVFAFKGELPWAAAALYIVAQVAGGIAGVVAHLMFELPVWPFSR